MIVRLVGGPFDGQDFTMLGGCPDYLMLLDTAFVDPGNASAIDWKIPLVVGAGFDDHWPGQARYDRAGVLMSPNEHDQLGLVGYVYRYAGPDSTSCTPETRETT